MSVRFHPCCACFWGLCCGRRNPCRVLVKRLSAWSTAFCTCAPHPACVVAASLAFGSKLARDVELRDRDGQLTGFLYGGQFANDELAAKAAGHDLRV